MPSLGGGGYYDLTPRNFEATDQQLNQAAATQFGITKFNPAEELGYGILGGVSDTIDSVSASLGFVTGSERGEINSFVSRTLGMPGFNQFMTEKQQSIEAISGISSVVLSAIATSRITAPAGFLMQGLRSTPYLRRIAALDNQYEAAMQTVLATRTALAGRGAQGAQQLQSRAVVDAMVFSPKTGQMVASKLTRSARGADLRAQGLGFVRGVRDAAVGEAVLGVIANQNSFLYDDDMAYNIAWGAVGLAGGGVLDSVMTRYRLRKLARTDAIERSMGEALDPGGYQQTRLESFLQGIGREGKPDERIDFFGGAFTDEATQLGIEINALKTASLETSDDIAALQSNRLAEITAKTEQQREAALKVTIRGIQTDGRTGFTLKNTTHGRHVDLMLHKDPMALSQVESIGAVTPDLPGSATIANFYTRVDQDIESVVNRIDTLRAEQAERQAKGRDLTKKQQGLLDAATTRLKRLQFMKTLDMHGVMDGELVSPSMLATYERYVDPRVFPQRLDAEKTFWEVAEDAVHGKGLLVGDNLELVMPEGKSLESLDYFDVLALYKMADTALDSLSRRNNFTVNLPENPTWFQLDMAEELMKRSDGKAVVMYPQGMTREKAQIESLIQKAAALKQIDRNPASTAAEEMHKARVRLNLPRLSSYEAGVLMRDEHELEFLLRGVANQDPDVIRGMSLDEIREGLQQVRTIENGVPVVQRDIDSIVGTSFRFMRDDFGQPLEPLVVSTRPNTAIDWTPDSVAERLAERKQLAFTKLTGQDAHPLTRELAESLGQSPDFHLASRPDQLMEAEIQGSIVGSTPQSLFGALTKELKPSDWNFRDSPVLLAAGRIRDAVSRITRARFADMAEAAFGESLKLLKNPRNSSSKLLLDTFHSHRGGWDLKPNPVARSGPEGKPLYAFELEASTGNQNRWRRLYGEAMPQGAVLRGFDGREVVLDDLALQIQQGYNQLSSQVIAMQNTVLRANGMGEIREQLWYVAPQEIKGKYAGWIMGPDRKPVAAIAAETQADFAKKQQVEMQRIAETKGSAAGYVFLTRDQITDFASLWDKAQMELMSPGTTAFLPGKSNKGNLSSISPRINAFEESLQAMQDRILGHGGEVVETMMREQIKAAGARAATAAATNPDVAKNRFAPEGFRTIHDYYLEALLGRSKSTHSGSITGGVSRHLEGISDQAIGALTSPAARAWAGLTERLSRTDTGLWDTSAKARQDYDALVTQLGEYMPFKSALELAEARGLGSTPLNTAKIVGGVNRLTAGLTLRFMEMAHPVLNLAGMVNAAPAIVRSMTPMANETREQFAARVGHSAMIFDLPDGRTFGVPDMTKIFNRAVKRAWNRKSEADYAYMLERGFIQQEVAEFHRQFGALDAKGPLEEKFSRIVEIGSQASDKSEDFSRSIGHMIGLELADRLGIVGRDARHMYAHDVANKMIANYDPHNRAEVFQGAFGSALGLFQSFAHNYYGRLFRYVETGDLRTFLTQQGVQASLFGMTGLTGWQEASDFVEWASDGERRPSQDIYGVTSTGLIGDIISNGLISQVPRIFSGGQLPAVDMYTRGDTNVRFPGMANGGLTAQAVPGFSAIIKLASGLQEGIAAFAQEGSDLSVSRIAEIASNMVVNRPIAGMIEVALNDGNSVDSRGQLINETKGAMESVYRMMGVRSRRQTLEREAFYADKRAQEIQRTKRDRLNLLTRNAIRNDDMDKLPRIYEEYLLTGGRPEYFRQWMKGAYEAATSTVAQRRLDELLRDPAKFGDAMRFMDMQVGIEEDEVAGQQEVDDSYEPIINF